ncbi:MAG: ABC transporter ATP-binding protein [archaeon]
MSKRGGRGRAAVTIKGLTKKYGENVVVDNASFSVRKGEFLVILGPSGCGKTTLLRIMGGLTRQTSGDVFFGKNLVNNLPPQKRDIGFLFQQYTLFKYMTIEENVEFGLKIKKVDKKVREKRARELIDLVGLSEHSEKLPSQLSGGQQQRVALARALARKPNLLLLDEPFGALDAKIRQKMRGDIKQIQKELGITTILVTHDQEEAFELGDRIVVMNRGKIEHIGTPQELYDHPKTSFVARFIGMVNILDGKIEKNHVKIGYFDLDLNGNKGFKEGDIVKVLIRPEEIEVEKALVDMKKTEELTTGKIMSMTFLGPLVRMRLSLGRGVSVNAVKPKTEVAEKEFKEGDAVFVNIPSYKIFPEEAEVLISSPVSKILTV